MMVGPAKSSPRMLSRSGAPARSSSSLNTARSLASTPPPPYCFGQDSPAYPASYSSRCPGRGTPPRRDCLSAPLGGARNFSGLRGFLFEASLDVFAQLVFEDLAGCRHRQGIDDDDALGCLLDRHASLKQVLPYVVDGRGVMPRRGDHVTAHL